MDNKQKLEPKYGLFMAISMVVGQVIGSGIFFKVDDVLATTGGDVFAGLLGFLIVGISVVFAGVSMAYYAELSPNGGGLLDYVEYRFGKKIGAYVGWVYFAMFFPILAAVLLSVSGIYITHFLAEFISFQPHFLHYSLIGVFNGFLFLAFNIFSPNKSGFFQQMTMTLKLVPLILISALGIVSWFGGGDTPLITNEIRDVGEEKSFWLMVLASFIPIAFSMDGWYAVLQIGGEVKDSQKNLPKALFFGTTIVLLVYVFYYLGIVSQLGSAEVMALGDTYISEWALRVGGNVGTLVMQLFIIISVLGTANGLVLATIRVPYQFSQLEKSKKFLNLDKIDEKTKMPMNSAYLAFAIILFYIFCFYYTNVNPFFTELNYDISAIPIVFIYLVNTCLFLGLLKYFRENKIKGNLTLKYLMLIFAILGTGFVFVGTLIAPNGFSYFLITMLYLALGKFFVKD